MNKGSINIYNRKKHPDYVKLVISFDTDCKIMPDSIFIATGPNSWDDSIGIDEKHIEELCEALMEAARHVRAARKTPVIS